MEWEKSKVWGNQKVDEFIQDIRQRLINCNFKKTIAGGEADKELSADLIVEFPDRTEAWAVKFRDLGKKTFHDVTVEYMNGTGERGDWFKFKGGIVQNYVYGFSNGEFSYSIIDVKKMMQIPEEEWIDGQNEEFGKANFKAISFKKLIKADALIKL
jgi:hypothetical protein